jgi:hypothetical protein
MSGQKSCLLPILIILGIVAGFLLVRSMLFRLLSRVSRRTETTIEDLLLAGRRFPSLFLVWVAATYIGTRLTDLPELWLQYATKGMHLSIILTITIGLANVSDRLLAYFLKRAEFPSP